MRRLHGSSFRELEVRSRGFEHETHETGSDLADPAARLARS